MQPLQPLLAARPATLPLLRFGQGKASPSPLPVMPADSVRFSSAQPLPATDNVDQFFPQFLTHQKKLYVEDIAPIRGSLQGLIETISSAKGGDADNIIMLNLYREQLDELLAEQPRPLKLYDLGPMVLPDRNMLAGANLEGANLSHFYFLAGSDDPAKSDVVSFMYTNLTHADLRLRQLDPDFDQTHRGTVDLSDAFTN